MTTTLAYSIAIAIFFVAGLLARKRGALMEQRVFFLAFALCAANILLDVAVANYRVPVPVQGIRSIGFLALLVAFAGKELQIVNDLKDRSLDSDDSP